MSLEIAFVGAGKMVSSIVRSILLTETFRVDQIACCSADDGTSENLSTETGISRFATIDQMLEARPSTLVLGCKPQQLSQLPDSIKKATDNCLILSIMAGITLARLQQSFLMQEI